MSRLMQGRIFRLSRAALLACVGALAGCTQSMPDFTQFKVPTTRSFLPENMDTYVPPASQRADRPVAPGELVDAQGACAGAPPTVAAAPPEAAPASPSAPPPAPVLRSVGLDMSECEVVQAIGPPQSANITAGERGERLVTMIYTGSERAGTYLFRNGRLTSLERGPEPPPPPKAEKPKKKKPVAKKPKPPQPQQPAT